MDLPGVGEPVAGHRPRVETVWFDLTLPVLMPGYTTGIHRTVRRVHDAWAENPRFATRYCAVHPGVGLLEVAPGWVNRPTPPPVPPPVVEPPAPPKKSRFRFVPWQLRNALRRLWQEPAGAAAPPTRPADPFHPFPPGSVSGVVTLGPTDLLFSLGGLWIQGDMAGGVERAKRAQGFQFASVVYDLIPFLAPHLILKEHVEAIVSSTDVQVRASDLILAISRHTGRDLEGEWARRRKPLPPVEVFTLGSDITPAPAADRGPPAHPFVLTVGTIEPRKNHLYMYYAWRKLVADLGPERAPDLVVAGKPGWLGDPILYMMRNDPLVKGKIVHAPDPTDRELAWLYRHCLFTLYPSVYEGWGLPVEESFAYGKLCVTTTATSLPEVGGEFADYVGPDDLEGLTAAIRRALDPDYRAGRELVIRERFRPNTWKQTAAQIQTILARHYDLSLAEQDARPGERPHPRLAAG